MDKPTKRYKCSINNQPVELTETEVLKELKACDSPDVIACCIVCDQVCRLTTWPQFSNSMNEDVLRELERFGPMAKLYINRAQLYFSHNPHDILINRVLTDLHNC